MRRKKKTCFSSSLLCPKMVNLSSAASLVRPSLLHLRFSNTSSMGMFSYNHKVHNIREQKPHRKNQEKQAKSFELSQIYIPNQPSPSARRPALQASPPPSSSSRHSSTEEEAFTPKIRNQRTQEKGDEVGEEDEQYPVVKIGF